jgi:hypothetical protein
LQHATMIAITLVLTVISHAVGQDLFLASNKVFTAQQSKKQSPAEFLGLDKNWGIELPISPKEGGKVCDKQKDHCEIVGSNFMDYSNDKYYKLTDDSVVLTVPVKGAGSSHGGIRTELKVGCDISNWKMDPCDDKKEHWLNVTQQMNHFADDKVLNIAQMHGQARAIVLIHWSKGSLYVDMNSSPLRKDDCKGDKTLEDSAAENEALNAAMLQSDILGSSKITLLKDWPLKKKYSLAMRFKSCKGDFWAGESESSLEKKGSVDLSSSFWKKKICKCGIWHTGSYDAGKKGDSAEMELFKVKYS